MFVTQPFQTPLVGFQGEQNDVKGQIEGNSKSFTKYPLPCVNSKITEIT